MYNQTDMQKDRDVCSHIDRDTDNFIYFYTEKCADTQRYMKSVKILANRERYVQIDRDESTGSQRDKQIDKEHTDRQKIIKIDRELLDRQKDMQP